MADGLAISNLQPAAALNGAELVAIVQSGETRRTTATNLAGLSHSSTTLNVRDFGAKGDNVNNDQVPIQAAIEAAEAGATLLFPKGIYRLATRLYVHRSLKLVGEFGAVLKLLNPTVSDPTTAMLLIANADGVELHGLTFDGNVPAFTEDKPIVIVSVAKKFKSIGCTYQNTRGMTVVLSTDCDDSVFSDNRFYNCGCADGRNANATIRQVIVYSGPNRFKNAKVIGNHFDTTGKTCIGMQQMDSGLVANNTAIRTYNGVYLQGSFDIAITGNVFDGGPDAPQGTGSPLMFPSHGIDCAFSQRVSITGNVVQRFAGTGIGIFQEMVDVTVSGNVTRDNGAQVVGGYFRAGITVGSLDPFVGPSNVAVVGNVSVDTGGATQQYGIIVYSDSSNIVIGDNNVCVGNVLAEVGYFNSGTFTVVSSRAVDQRHPGYIAGRFYATLPNAAPIFTQAIGAVDTIYFYPFQILRSVTVKTLHQRVQTGGAGSSVKCGIWYDSAISHRPLGAPVIADNTGQSTATSLTTTTADVTDTMLLPGIYWWGTKATGTLPTLWSLPLTSTILSGLPGQTSAVLASSANGISIADAYANALPTIAEGATFAGVGGGVPVGYFGA